MKTNIIPFLFGLFLLIIATLDSGCNGNTTTDTSGSSNQTNDAKAAGLLNSDSIWVKRIEISVKNLKAVLQNSDDKNVYFAFKTTDGRHYDPVIFIHTNNNTQNPFENVTKAFTVINEKSVSYSNSYVTGNLIWHNPDVADSLMQKHYFFEPSMFTEYPYLIYSYAKISTRFSCNGNQYNLDSLSFIDKSAVEKDSILACLKQLLKDVTPINPVPPKQPQ